MYEIPILSELKPAAGVVSVLYSPTDYLPPLGGLLPQTATGTVFAMNQGINDDQVSVALVPNGETLSTKHWICRNSLLAYGHSLYLQQLCLNNNDAVIVNSQNGTTNFIFNGIAYA